MRGKDIFSVEVTMNNSLKDFLHCVGFVSIRDFFKSAYVWTRVFLLLYSFVLLSGFGLDWFGFDREVFNREVNESALLQLGMYALALVVLIWGVKNRKSVFAELEGIFAGLKDLPGWALALMFGGAAVMVASSAWFAVVGRVGRNIGGLDVPILH